MFRHDYNNIKLKLESTVPTMSATDWLMGCTPGALLDADTRSDSQHCQSTSTAGASDGPQTSTSFTRD